MIDITLWNNNLLYLYLRKHKRVQHGKPETKIENHQDEIGDQITNEFLPSGNLSEEIMVNEMYDQALHDNKNFDGSIGCAINRIKIIDCIFYVNLQIYSYISQDKLIVGLCME